MSRITPRGASVLLGAIVLLAACGGDTPTVRTAPPTVLVPDVTGMASVNAETAVLDAGLTFQLEASADTDVKLDVVGLQAPEPGVRVPVGSTVTLYVGQKPPKQVEVPNVVGENVRKAGNDLLDIGLDSRIEKKASSKPAGTVLSQDPKPGKKVDEGTVVTLVVSKADPKAACAKGKFCGRLKDTYEISRDVCAAFPLKQIAKEFRSKADPDSAAYAYSRDYQPAFQQAAYEGCFDGIIERMGG